MLKLMSYWRSIGLPRVSARAGEVAVLVRLVGGAEGVRHVVADRRVALPVAVPVAREAIAAGLDGDAHVGAAAEAVGARAGAADLELLEAAEVEVAGVGAGAFGGVDAFELGLVLIAEAVGEEAGLRAGARAADVVRGHLDAGRLRHGGPDVARVRDLGEQFLGEVGADLRRRRIDDRGCAGHGDRFLERRHVQLLIDGQGLVDDDAHAFALEVLEAGQFERNLVHARRQGDEAISAVDAGGLHLGLDERRACGGHRDTRQNRAGVIRHCAVDSASKILCESGRCDRQQRDAQAVHGQPVQPHYSSSNQLKRVNANEKQHVRTRHKVMDKCTDLPDGW